MPEEVLCYSLVRELGPLLAFRVSAATLGFPKISQGLHMIVCLKSVDATTAVSNVLEQSETGFSKRAERLQPLAVSALDVGL